MKLGAWSVEAITLQCLKCIKPGDVSNLVLRPGPTAEITKTIKITTQRERILLVELLRAEIAHALSTNGMRSLCVVIVIILVIAAGGPGLKCTCCGYCRYLT